MARLGLGYLFRPAVLNRRLRSRPGKRGNPYLRKMFIHGARAAVLRVKREGSCLGQWMSGLETRAARNVVIVATANKLARISWAVLSSGENYHPMHTAVRCSS
jgi:transposase